MSSRLNFHSEGPAAAVTQEAATAGLGGKAVKGLRKDSKGCPPRLKDIVAVIIGIDVGIAVAIGVGFLTFGVGSPFLLYGFAAFSGVVTTGCAGAIAGVIFGVGSRAIMNCSSKRKAELENNN